MGEGGEGGRNHVHHPYIKTLHIFTQKHNIPWCSFLNLEEK